MRDGHAHNQYEVEKIQEEKSYGSEMNQEQDGSIQQEEQPAEHEEQFDPQKEMNEFAEDEEFDFGKAKMDFFKQRARQILVESGSYEQNMPYYEGSNPGEYAYEGKPLSLKLCYQQLQNVIKRPVASVGVSDGDKPNYMKMTFAMSRSCAPNSKLFQLSSMVGSLK